MPVISVVQQNDDGTLAEIEEVDMDQLPRAGDTLTFRLEHSTDGYVVERNEFQFDHVTKHGEVGLHYQSELRNIRCFVRASAPSII